MKPEELLAVLEQAGRLKQTTRHCYTEADRKESVADHSWRIALMAMLMSSEDEFASLDMDKVIRMCLIHDLGETFTGDIPTFMKNRDHAAAEDDLFRTWVSSFSEPVRSSWLELLDEMEALETKEAKLFKSLDKVEALISHNESDLSTWLPLEYDLQMTYGKKEMQEFEYTKELRELVDDWTLKKIEEGK